VLLDMLAAFSVCSNGNRQEQVPAIHGLALGDQSPRTTHSIRNRSKRWRIHMQVLQANVR
jgi:hypothetical protein